MEAVKQTETAKPELEGQGREVLRGIAKRRLQRKGRRLVRSLEKRGRAFRRGARLGYAIQENPGRAAVAAFAIGCVAGALWLGLNQNLAEFRAEEMPEEDEDLEYESEAI